MLYNVKWDKPKDLRFIQWLNTQPDDKAYTHTNAANCPYAQYLRSRHIFASVGPFRWVGFVWGILPWSGRMDPRTELALSARPWTMAALRQRLSQ